MVKTTEKVDASVSTRFQERVLVPVEDHPEVLLGAVTWYAAAERARDKTTAKACIFGVMGCSRVN